MNDCGKGVLGHWDATSEDVRRALTHAIADALRAHKLAGNSVVVWDRENDRIVEIPAEEIVVPEAAEVVTARIGVNGD